MTKQIKRAPVAHTHLFLMAGFLLAFALGLVVAWFQPNVVVVLVCLVLLVVMVLLAQGSRFWKLVRQEELRRLARVRSRQAQKEVRQ